jgi:hypothetical protein
MYAVHWIHGTGCVFGQGAARQNGGAPALLVPPPAILLEAHQGKHLPNRCVSVSWGYEVMLSLYKLQ